MRTGASSMNGSSLFPGDMRRRKAYDDTTAAMIKATATLVIQGVPPGSGEEAVGRGGVVIERRRGFRGAGNQVADEKDK